MLSVLARDKKYAELTGSDISEAALVEARGSCPSCRFVRADGKEWIAGAPFDLITCMATLDVIEDDDSVIAASASMLHAGGYFIAAVQHRVSYWTILDDTRNFRRYEREDLIEKCRRAGLRPVKLFTWGWPLYQLYYRMLVHIHGYNLSGYDASVETERMPRRFSRIRQIGSRCLAEALYYFLMGDDLFIRSGRGRWLFGVFQK